MAPNNEKTTFGASVIEPTHDDTLLPPTTLDSPALSPVASHDDMHNDYISEKPIPPHSPFYTHPPASFERIHSRTTSKTAVNATEKDLEYGIATPVDEENPFTSKISVQCDQQCQRMWPSRNTLVQQRTNEKMRKREGRGLAGCAPVKARWAKYNKRQKLYVKIVVALFLIGVAVALGVGISVAVHGTYYGRNGSQQPVGGSK